MCEWTVTCLHFSSITAVESAESLLCCSATYWVMKCPWCSTCAG